MKKWQTKQQKYDLDKIRAKHEISMQVMQYRYIYKE